MALKSSCLQLHMQSNKYGVIISLEGLSNFPWQSGGAGWVRRNTLRGIWALSGVPGRALGGQLLLHHD